MNLDFSKLKIVLIGDLMLDEYIFGESIRMSPEAKDVPIVKPYKNYFRPGGAANVAMNLGSLGIKVHCIGYVGDDIYGEKILSILQDDGHDISGIDILPNYPTILKKRIFSNSHQIVRVDIEEKIDWEPNLESVSFDDFNIFIVSDYDKGAVNNIKPQNITTIVDPKNKDFSRYKFANIITPNLNELQSATNCNINSDSSILSACNKLISEIGFDFVIAKKGDRGMSIVGKDNFLYHIKALNVKAVDVTGAGDTVISAFSAAYAMTGDIKESSEFANIAAGLVVSKMGTETISIKELKEYF